MSKMEVIKERKFPTMVMYESDSGIVVSCSQLQTRSPSGSRKDQVTSRNSDRSHSVSHMYITILQLLKLYINNLFVPN